MMKIILKKPILTKKIQNNKLSLITVGKISNRKGQLNVLKSLPRIIKKYPTVHYHMVGIPDELNKLNIKKDSEILTMCMGGARSQAAAELISKENYKCSNISDGFLGNNENIGWKENNLPCK